MEVKDFIVLFIAVSLLINVAFIMVPAVSRNCDAIPATTHTVFGATFIGTVGGWPTLTPDGISMYNSELYLQTYTRNQGQEYYYKYPYDPVTNDVTQPIIIGAIARTGEGQGSFTSIGVEMASMRAPDVVFFHSTNTGITQEFTADQDQLDAIPTGVSMEAFHLFTHTADGTIYRYDINRNLDDIDLPAVLENRVTMGNVGLNLVGDFSVDGDLLYTMSSNGKTVYKWDINNEPGSITNKVQINGLNVSAPLFFTSEGDNVFVVGGNNEIETYHLGPVENTNPSWRDACERTEEIAQSSFRILAVMTLVIGAVAVLFVIRQL